MNVKPHKPESDAISSVLPTVDSLKAEVTKAGFTLLTAWEDEYMVYAASAEAVPGCYGHPQFEATYSKLTGWVRIGKQPAFKV